MVEEDGTSTVQRGAFRTETTTLSPNEAPTRSVGKLTTAWLCGSSLYSP
ncbi:unnamed protein product, partial [Vitis vinifera]|uniref:Uncharacterized protein n=1 Tax=Vitis vinifera TaxID=29760 RepID=D7TND3_VITVI